MKKIVLCLALMACSVAGFNATTLIVSSGFAFSPDAVTINVGDSVNFQLGNIHNALEVSQSTYNANGTTPLSGGFSVPFGGGWVLPANLSVGVHYYVCTNHASMGMKGTITVSQSAAPTVVFQTMYGLGDSTSDSWAANTVQTTDGGYVTVGYISNFGAGGDDVSLVKLNSNGDTSWVKTSGTATDDDASEVIKTIDGGFAVVGFSSTNNGGNAFLQKNDANGNLSWSKIYGSGDANSDSWFSSATQASDGSFLLGGYISNYGAGGDDFYLIKTDVSGTVAWTKTYGGGSDDDAYSIAPTNDGGYVLTGMATSFADTLGDVYLVKVNANGDTLWSWTYGSNLTDAMDQANSVQQTSDNGYIIAGVTVSNSQGEYALLIKTDSNGVIQWSKLYGNGTTSSDAQAQAVVQTADGGYAFAGYISNYGAGDDDYYLVKTNATGDTVFTRTFGSAGADDASGIIQTTDGGYMISGWTNGFQYGGGHAYYVKVDSNGHEGSCNEYNTATTVNGSITFTGQRVTTQVSTGGVAGDSTFTTYDGGTMLNPNCESPANGIHTPTANNLDISVFPIPFSNDATVKINAGHDLTGYVFVMYDAVGREVSRTNVPAGGEFNIHGGNLSDGLYLYRVANGSQIAANGKLMIAH